MCEPRGVKDTLRDIPFKVSSLEAAMPHGSHEKSLVRSVCDSVRKDVEYCLKRLEAGLKD